MLLHAPHLLIHASFSMRKRLYLLITLVVSSTALTALNGCSFVSPNLKVKTPNAAALKVDEDQHFLTSFQSCFSPPSRVPNSQASTRQLFVGWSDVMLGEPVKYDYGWNGFTVSGTLDNEPLSAIAISKPAAIPGCIDEVVAFGPQKTNPDSALHALSTKLTTYLAQATEISGTSGSTVAK